MGLLGQIFGLGAKEAGEGIGEVMKGAGTLAKDIRSAITGELSPEAKAELEKKTLELEAMLADGQMKINLVEAQSGSLFVAGARPAAMWVCVIGLAYSFLVQPVLSWLSVNFGIISPPMIDSNTLLTLIMGMLGLGTMRTFEKMKNAQGNH